MITHTAYLEFHTKNRVEFLNITDRVEEEVRASGVQDGLVLVHPMHITAAVYVNDAESGLIRDYQEWLEQLAPERPSHKPDWAHNSPGDDNAYAHLRRQLMAHQVTLAITKGSLDLGQWEQVFYAEFDGKRKKRVLVKIVGV